MQRSHVEIHASDSKALLKICLVLKFLESFAYFTLNNIFTLHLTEELGLSDAWAGTFFGLRGALTILYASVLGPAVDCLGVPVSLRLAFVCAAIGRLGFALAHSQELALLAVCGPMAVGHGLLAPVLTIGVKRATMNDKQGTEAWAYGCLYWSTVLGILLCGPTIDVATILLHGKPYRKLALLTSAASAVGFLLSCLLRTTSCDEDQSLRLQPAGPRAARSTKAAGSLKSDLDKDHTPHSRISLTWLHESVSSVLTRRFLRFCAYSVAVLPACSVLRNLDGGIFPKFMLRSFGPHVPKGTIYAMNPALDLLLVPIISARAKTQSHFTMIRAGLAVAALSPIAVLFFGNSIVAVLLFVLVLTAGDILYNPRMDAYAMALAPQGHEGTFAGVSSAIVFLADVPTGLLGGVLLQNFCPGQLEEKTLKAAESCNGRGMFGALCAFALLTPLLLFSCPLQEPDICLTLPATIASTDQDEPEVAQVEEEIEMFTEQEVESLLVDGASPVAAACIGRPHAADGSCKL